MTDQPITQNTINIKQSKKTGFTNHPPTDREIIKNHVDIFLSKGGKINVVESEFIGGIVSSVRSNEASVMV